MPTNSTDSPTEKTKNTASYLISPPIAFQLSIVLSWSDTWQLAWVEPFRLLLLFIYKNNRLNQSPTIQKLLGHINGFCGNLCSYLVAVALSCVWSMSSHGEVFMRQLLLLVWDRMNSEMRFIIRTQGSRQQADTLLILKTNGSPTHLFIKMKME